MERLELGLGLSFFYFILNSPPLTRDETCSVTLLGREIYEEAMPDEHPLSYNNIKTNTCTHFFHETFKKTTSRVITLVTVAINRSGKKRTHFFT